MGLSFFIDDLKELMGTASGRRIIGKLFEESKLFEDNDLTNARVYLQNGQRTVGNVFWKVIHKHLLKDWADAEVSLENDKAEIRLNLIDKKGGY